MEYIKTLKKGESLDGLSIVHQRGTPLADWNLTGYTIVLRFKNYYKGNIVKEQTIGNGLLLQGVNFNTIVTSPFIVDWQVGTYVFDIDLISPTGTYSKSYFGGTINVKEGV